jgi:L-alanine-DL-glutamate epimerase-like enolase superfamily enzyme
MTDKHDKHDKLVEMALASGAQYHVTTDPGVWLELDAEALAAFAAADSCPIKFDAQSGGAA